MNDNVKTTGQTRRENSHGFHFRCTRTHHNWVTCINTWFFVNCGVGEGNWRLAYCPSEAWGVVEAHGLYYDLILWFHSSSVLKNHDGARRLKKNGQSKQNSIYETKNIPRSTANSSAAEAQISRTCLQILHLERAPLVKLVWALVTLCFWRVKNKSL